jgi:UDP:flavonoid glycosyltransferase YjiC (YdhE family)
MLISLSIEEKFILVISCKSDRRNLATIPGNVHIFDSVPQLEVLKHSDVFISHGGLNSIKEAVYADVPMLLYPLHDELDPKGNAARVSYHGLGKIGNAASETMESMRIKIKELISDSTYKKKLEAMKNVDKTYATDRLLEWIKALSPVI